MGEQIITLDMVESGSTITACKMLGTVPESHEADEFNLYVRTVGSTVRVDRSDTDETIVSAVGFLKAMTALADHYGLPVVVQADPGVKITKKAAELIGRYEPSTVRTEVRIMGDGDTTLIVGDLITAKDMADAPVFEITAIGGGMGVVVRDVATGLRHVPRDIRYVVPGYLTVKATPAAETAPSVPVMVDDLIADKVDGFTYVVTRADEFWVGLRQVGSWREGRNIRTADFVKHMADGALVNVSEGAQVVKVVARLNYFGRTLVNGADVMLEVKPEHVQAALNADMITVDGEWMSVTPAGMDLLGEGDRARAWGHFNPGVLGVAAPTERVFSDRDLRDEVLAYLGDLVNDFYVDGIVDSVIKGNNGAVSIDSIGDAEWSRLIMAHHKRTMPTVEIHTDSAVITEVDVVNRFKVAFQAPTEAQIWAGTYTMIKPSIRAGLKRRSRKSARRARRGLRGGM